MSKDNDKPIEESAFKKSLGMRLDCVAELVGGKRALAKKANLPVSQVYKYVDGDHIPRLDVVVAVAKAANVSVEWLATGVGQMEVSAENHDATVSFAESGDLLAEHNHFIKPITGVPLSIASEETGIPVVRLKRVLAGEVLTVDEFDAIQSAFRKDKEYTHASYRLKLFRRRRIQDRKFIIPQLLDRNAKVTEESPVDRFALDGSYFAEKLNTDTENLALHEVNDDDMLPTLAQGDVVLVDKSIESFSGNGLYIIVINKRFAVRRMQMTSTGKLLVKCDDRRYGTETYEKEAIDWLNVVGKIRWFGKFI